MMLSTGEDIEEITTGSEEDCGDDGYCFDRAFRVCKPITFRPEGRGGPVVELVGLEDGKCVLKATLPEGEGPPPGFIPGVDYPIQMTCKIEKYALGIKTPEKDIFPYCEGSMAKLLKYCADNPQICPEGPSGGGEGGGPGPGPGQGPPPGFFAAFIEDGKGPGGCTGKEDCKAYCSRNMFDCIQYADDWLARNGGPGGIRSMREFGDFCQKPGNGITCFQWFTSRGVSPEDLGPPPTQQQYPPPSGGQYPPPPGGQYPQQPPSGSYPQEQINYNYEQGEQCAGCLNNGNCDPGECSYCGDCQSK